MTAEVLDDFSDVGADTAEKQPVSNSRSAPSPSRGRPGRRIGDKRLDTLQVKLSKEMYQLGAISGMAFHTTGYYIAQESHDFTTALVQLASQRKEWIEALEHLADIGPGITVGRTVLGIGTALAVDRGRVDPQKNKFAAMLGVTAAWMAVNNIEPGEGSYAFKPPPGKFQPVS